MKYIDTAIPMGLPFLIRNSRALPVLPFAHIFNQSTDVTRNSAMAAKPKIVVVGAGAFGGWTALSLLRRGATVILLDAWGAGNARASSGGETRIIRGSYGPNQPYTGMTARAFQLWAEQEKHSPRQYLYRTGVLWMVTSDDDQFERGSLPLLRENDIPYEELSPKEIAQRWPQIRLEGVRWGIFEPESGYLMARLACQAVLAAFIAGGGEYRQALVSSRDLENNIAEGLPLEDGQRIRADQYVFACGPWLGQLFPTTVGNFLRPTKQDVFFFGTPAGDDRFSTAKLPVWADHHQRFMYGIPANDGRGFKVADDTRGPEFDPTHGERNVDPETLRTAREYLTQRFPALKDAPLLETRVCQYENSPDHHLLLDRHPSFPNVWLAGGGSGHGFKLGPAVGEILARAILVGHLPDALFRLARMPVSERKGGTSATNNKS
jgi:glycine/D-amino acid oxidase-like deaminating enzyme